MTKNTAKGMRTRSRRVNGLIQPANRLSMGSLAVTAATAPLQALADRVTVSPGQCRIRLSRGSACSPWRQRVSAPGASRALTIQASGSLKGQAVTDLHGPCKRDSRQGRLSCVTRA
jgi:hypothetical protein